MTALRLPPMPRKELLDHLLEIPLSSDSAEPVQSGVALPVPLQQVSASGYLPVPCDRGATVQSCFVMGIALGGLIAS